MSPTLPDSPIEIIRTWESTDGDLTLSFSLHNTLKTPLELGGLGFPLTSDSVFTDRTAVDINAQCSLIDPNIGLDGGYAQVTRIDGRAPAMVITPINSESRLEGWGFLHEAAGGDDPLGYQTESFEGFYQWMPLTLAYQEEEWNKTVPWNEPTSYVLKPAETLVVGLRFTLVPSIPQVVQTVKNLDIPIAEAIPGYIIPEDLPGQLRLGHSEHVLQIYSEPPGALTVSRSSADTFRVTPRPGTLGRVRLTIEYMDGRRQTLHYYLTKSAPRAVQDVGRFLNDRHWWINMSDPFGRAPSFMCVDHSDGVGQVVIQDYLTRVWLSGECHEAGASWYTMALKQFAQPEPEEIAKLELFVHEVLWKTIQLPSYAVRQSIFWYNPNLTDYIYNPAYPWWPETETNYSVSWNQATVDVTSRSYGYTYPATTYWALYRVGRTHASMLSRASWSWYLSQAYRTLVYCFETVDGKHLQPLWADGLMGETVYGELLKDLYREGWTAQARHVETLMRARVDVWKHTAIPFGSELGWDCTGEEGVFYWSNYFGNTATIDKTIRTIQGYMPSISHWGYNGNARRYWDFQFDGKIDRIERQIHHYGSALNALPLLGYLRAFPGQATEFLVRLAYGGMFAPLTNIHGDGFASAAFHSWAETLAWDNYTGDYGPGFAGLMLGSATYVLDDPDHGLEVFGGLLDVHDGGRDYSVYPRDALRRRVYLHPLNQFVEIDAGSIASVTVREKRLELRISRAPTPGAASVDQCVLWVDQSFHVNESSSRDIHVSGMNNIHRERAGWMIPLTEHENIVYIQKYS
ncbi:uncharacterized protein PFLUO_LOCUS5247 [Penicillium psychrofluorescens]|uniref:uncharacterized protein n=1 Tax=Penicillium psychrofluorescens TaxID=3158075 RepID=UPI003CCE471D